MAQVVPAERGLRRVIGDGESVPDGEVEGLDESDFLELYRQLVLLRTYDERSLVYHRQGRIGTYAIFWNHEAMQVGSHYALERERLDLPVVPRVGDRAAARDAAGDGALVVARPSGRLVEPARLQPRLDLRPDRDARAARGRARVGEEAARREDGRDRVLRRRRDLRGRVPRGRELRRRDAGAASILFCNNNQWAISTPLSAQTAAPTLADKAIGYGMPGAAGGRRRRARRLRGDARGGRAGARRRRADVHRGGHLPRGAARDRRRPVASTSTRERVEEEKAQRVRRAVRGLPAAGRRARRRRRSSG